MNQTNIALNWWRNLTNEERRLAVINSQYASLVSSTNTFYANSLTTVMINRIYNQQP